MTKIMGKLKEKTKSIKKKASKQKPLYEEVSKRAYKKFEQRGCCHGENEDDWYSAEKELNEE